MSRILLVIPLLLTSSCLMQGPAMVTPSRTSYNEAVATSANEQLLLNIVRLHYRDTPVFLELSQIISQYSFDTNIGAGGNIPAGSKTFFSGGNVNAGGRYGERPTLTFKPLTGDQFTQKMLTPLAAESLFMLADAGWDTQRLMMCCVQEINGLRNLPTSLDSSLSAPNSFDQFKSTAEMLSRLQKEGQLKLALAADNSEQETTMVRLPSGGKTQKARRIRQALSLDSDRETFPLYNRSWSGKRNEISIKGRSLLGSLQFLSRFVGQPEEHTRLGLAEVSKQQATTLGGDLLDVRVSKTQPKLAFTAVNYRGHWFYIADNDRRSKSTFGLLSQLLFLQAKEQGQSSSLLTLPVN